jgi:hypothetical protein
MMAADRRHEKRYVVDGLRAELDGAPQQILDISASGVRLLCPEMPPITTRLRLISDEPFDAFEVTMLALLQRSTPIEAIYRYYCPLPNWRERLASFDVFADLALDILEQPDGA